MTARKADLTAYAVMLVLLVSGCAWCAFQYRQTKAHHKHVAEGETAVDHIRHADTYYWFAMMIRGSQYTITSGQKEAELADQALQAELTAGSMDAATEARERKRLDGTWTDLRYQKNLYYNTFHGVFPYSHYMAQPTLFRNPHSMHSYELLDDPWEVAARDGLEDLIDKVLETQTVVAQHDVVFVTDPDDFRDSPELDDHISDPYFAGDRWPNSGQPRDDRYFLTEHFENEALYQFNLNPRFFVHNRLEVETTLTEGEFADLRRFKVTSETLAKLREEWGHHDLLVVRVKKMDETHGYYFYSAQARLFRGTDSEPAVVYNNYGFSKDRRFMLGPILVLNVLMLLSAIVLFRLLGGLSALDGQPPSWRDAIGLGTLCFLWGRVAVWGLAEIVEELLPQDETLAILSFWWPAITGLVMLLGPAFVMRFAEERFGWLGERFRLFNRGGAVFATAAVGSYTTLAQAALWVGAWGGWALLPPLLVAAVFATWIIGRALDSTDPIAGKWAALMALLVAAVGMSFATSSSAILWCAATPVAGVAVLAHRSGRALSIRSESGAVESESDTAVDDVASLIQVAQHPPFHRTASYEQVFSTLDTWDADGKTVRLQLIGSAGVGKSAIMRELQRHKWPAADVAIMDCICPEPTAGSVPEPYEPFARGIAKHFSINLLMPPTNQLAGLDKAVDGIFEEVVPFSDLLFPPTHRHGGASGSKSELFQSIGAMLKRLAQQRRVLVIVDDAHWIDAGSRELLEYLLHEFPAGGDVGIAILVASRNPLDVFSAGETIPLAELTPDEIEAVLVEGLNFDPSNAWQLADSVQGQEGNLHWLFQMIIHMASTGALSLTDDGFAWDDSTQLSDHLPDDLLTSVHDALVEHPEFRQGLECAACIGPEFTLSVLSDALGMPRLQCVHLLDRIESQTGLIRDLQHDERFAFRSSFMLEAVRSLLGVNAHGPSKPSPQRIREYHTQVAASLESRLHHLQKGVFRLATHRYAAGLRHADTAMQDSLNAARTASAQYQHSLARQFVEMARECATVAVGGDEELERELLLIECHEAHIEGTRRVETAAKSLDWLAAHEDSGFDVYVSVAQACYDAGIDTREQAHFANCVAVAEEIVSRFEAPLEKAEGHHFQGIALPVSEVEDRRRHLTTALELTESESSSIEALRLKSRVCNSLGEQLSYGTELDRLQAREMFETSIDLKSRPAIRDTEGLGFAHGGLGRLSFFAAEPDYDAARKHFAQDLNCSERIGSRTGQTKMHSLLGACDLKQNQDYESAQNHYRTALALAEDPVDRYFALGGLLECSGALESGDNMTRYGTTLLNLLDHCLAELPEDVRDNSPVAAVPRMCQPAVKAGLDACAAASEEEWHVRISEILAKE